MPNGIIVINKGEGVTSHGVVSRVRRLFSENKAGHTGTLDPLATGVLPVLLGKGVKASEYMLSSDKHYLAELTLGVETDTEDITGEVLNRYEGDMPSEESVRECISRFVGDIRQTPPMYSALKVDGKKLCDLAREGVTVEREPRDITVFSIETERISDSRYSLRVHCSKGTYIRTLCADIGRALGVGGCMSALQRTHASVFTLDDAYTLEELSELSEEERLALVVPTERIFEHLPEVKLPEFFSRLAHSGLEIYLKKLGVKLTLGERVRLLDESGEFFALGEVRAFDDGLAVKPIKQF